MSIKIMCTTVAALAVGTVAFATVAQAANIRAVAPVIPHITAPAPAQFNHVNFSNPASVRQFLSKPQPTVTSSGRYLPWMVKNPYGIQGASQNVAGRAVLGCGC